MGSKLHLAGERGGLPISVVLSAANANDSTMFGAVLDDVPPIRMSTGRRRRRPGKVHADKAYDHRRCREISAPAAAHRPANCAINCQVRSGDSSWVKCPASGTSAWSTCATPTFCRPRTYSSMLPVSCSPRR
jgi:hypothetical protein